MRLEVVGNPRHAVCVRIMWEMVRVGMENTTACGEPWYRTRLFRQTKKDIYALVEKNASRREAELPDSVMVFLRVYYGLLIALLLLRLSSSHLRLTYHKATYDWLL